MEKKPVSDLVPLARIMNDQPIQRWKIGYYCLIASTTTDIVCTRHESEQLQPQKNGLGRGLKKSSGLSLAPGYDQL